MKKKIKNRLDQKIDELAKARRMKQEFKPFIESLIVELLQGD